MPRKFRCYIPKGASRKAQKGTASFPCQEEDTCGESGELCTDIGVQTDDIHYSCSDAEVQTESFMALKVDVAVQTDEQNLSSLATAIVEEQTENPVVEESSSMGDSPVDLALPDTQVDMQICKGNDDEKFTPLILKHKGIFMNVQGIS